MTREGFYRVSLCDAGVGPGEKEGAGVAAGFGASGGDGSEPQTDFNTEVAQSAEEGTTSGRSGAGAERGWGRVGREKAGWKPALLWRCNGRDSGAGRRSFASRFL